MMAASGTRRLPPWVDYGLLPLLNLVVAFLIAGLVVIALGESPLEASGYLVRGAFGNADMLSWTLFYATNFVFSGLAVAIAFHAGLFNIGAEGQAYIGGLGLTLVCLYLGDLPFLLVLPLAMIGSALFGAAWASIPGWLQAKRGSHIVITTIMFNFIAASVMTYLLVYVLIRPGSSSPETIVFPETSWLPQLWQVAGSLGLSLPESPLNLSFAWALACALLFWLFLTKTRPGFELRVVGRNDEAAVYAGISPAKWQMIAMALSGALASFIALNEIMGSQHRLLLNFTGGYGFVGIAVALMGRNHPIGIILAAILFGALYQGGSELAFDMPAITKDMVVVVQGLVILFAGALEHFFRPTLERLFRRQSGRSGMIDLPIQFLLLLDSTVRLAAPLVLAALAGLFCERAGVVNIALEGKMLGGAFAAAAAAELTGSAWMGLLAAMLFSCGLALVHGFATITHKGDQVVSGMALNILVAGLGPVLANAWFQQAGRIPVSSDAARFAPIDLPFVDLLRAVPVAGSLYGEVVSGHNLLVYIAAAAVPLTWWVVWKTRFGLRLRAVGENPAAVDTAGISVQWMRYQALIVSGAVCGIAGAYLSIAQNAGYLRDMSAGKGYLALAALIFGKWRPVLTMLACLLFAFTDALQIRLQGNAIPGIGEIPTQFVQAIPYVVTVFLLAGFVGRAVAPKAIGVPYSKDR